MTIKHLTVLVLLVILLSACGPSSTPEIVGPAVKITVDPNPMKVGETAIISINVQSVAYLAGVDLSVVYDTTAVRVNVNDDGEVAAITDIVKPEFVAMNTAVDGEVRVAYASIDPATQPDGTLFTFTVEPLMKGTTTLRFANVQLATQGGAPAEVTAVDLSVKVK